MDAKSTGRPRARSAIAAVAIAGAVLAAVPARGALPLMDQARQAYEQSRHAQAYQLYRDALAQQGNRRLQLVDIYLHLGVLAASMGHIDEAIDNFTRALYLEPRATLSDRVSPGVSRQFAIARQRSRGLQHFVLRHDTAGQLTAAGALEVNAELVPDAIGMASALTLRYRPAGRKLWGELSRSGSGPIHFVVPASELIAQRDVEYQLWVRDPYGGILYELGHEWAPLVARPASSSSAPAIPAQAFVSAEEESPPLPLAAPGESSEDGAARSGPSWVWLAAGTGALLLVTSAAAATAIAVSIVYASGADFQPIRSEVAPLR
jgi:tetratricopeptide (TPR) repeat protein